MMGVITNLDKRRPFLPPPTSKLAPLLRFLIKGKERKRKRRWLIMRTNKRTFFHSSSKCTHTHTHTKTRERERESPHTWTSNLFPLVLLNNGRIRRWWWGKSSSSYISSVYTVSVYLYTYVELVIPLPAPNNKRHMDFISFNVACP